MYFVNEKMLEGITLIEDFSATKMYLIEGSKKAVLIDTGVGFLGLSEYIASLTDLPVEVVITHGHLDHAGGIDQFGKVFMSAMDLPMLQEAMDRQARLDFARSLCGKHCLPEELTPGLLSEGRKQPEISYLKDGMTFDLGGRTLTVITAPGHTLGTCTLYDDLTESLFIGDACNPSSYLFLDGAATIEEYLESIRKLEKWVPRVKHCFFQHDYGMIEGEGPISIIDDVKECCEKILSRTDAAVPFSRDCVDGMIKTQPLSANPLDEQLMRTDGKLGNIIYSPDRIYAEHKEEKPVQEFCITDDGIRLHAKLDRPEGKEKCPLVIIIHGLTGHMEERHIIAVQQAVCEAGFAALRVEMYGHGKSGGDFYDHTLFKWIGNVLKVIEYAKSLDFVTDLYICGHSQGGLLTILAAGMYPDDFKAVIPLAPALIIPDGARKGELVGISFDPAHLPVQLPVGERAVSGNYIRTAQLLHAEDAISRYHGPVLIIHGDEDEAVPLQYSIDAAAQYENCSLVVIPGDDHCYNRHLDQVTEAVKDFLRQFTQQDD